MLEKEVEIISNKNIVCDIFEMKIEAEKNLTIKAGAFISVAVPGGDFLLKRPFCIYDYEKVTGILTFRYQILGEGTKRLSLIKNGSVRVTYPLGKTFDVSSYQKIAVIGGGIGVFPLHLLKNEGVEIVSFLGFKNSDYAKLAEDFEKFSSKTFISTDDGSVGEKGFVTNLFAQNLAKIKVDAVFACGPKVMLKSLKNLNIDLPTYVSLEERMGCGVGACLVCVCKTEKNGELNNKRVCVDGPVFSLSEVVL